jgi:lipopolysaccharide export system protein LptA
VEVARKLGDAPEETTSSRELVAKFGKPGEWSAIDQTGDVHFHDALRSGQGDRAHVDHASNTVTLDGAVLFADATTRTSAQSATFVSSANSVHADGHVLTTELRAGSSSMSNLAPEPAHISAEHLVADTLHGHAVYTGKCRFWQGQSLVEGDAIELDNTARTVKVRGNVRGTFPQAAWNPKPGEGPGQRQSSSKTAKMAPGKSASPGMHAAPALGRVRGGTLTYWDKESRGEIEQDARVDSEQASIQADHIDLYFTDAGAASGTKQLSRSVASGDVLDRQDDRRGKSDRAEYTASEGKFVLSGGNPTLYSSTGDTTTGRQLTFFFADDRILVDSADGSKTVTLHPVEK